MNNSVKEVLKDFYSNNIKLGYDGSEHNAGLGSLRPDEAATLAEVVEKYRPAKTLEIGLAMGGSAVAIAASKSALGINEPHVVLDPFQHSRAKDSGLLEIKRLGFQNAVKFYPRFSEDFLNECYLNGTQFDFIFIDGSHTIGQAVTDVFLADKVLKPGGIIAVHDALLFSTSASIKYLLWERGYHTAQLASPGIKAVLRMVKYANRLGLSYAWNVIPGLGRSLALVQKGK